MGILIMNIPDFALPAFAAGIPVSTVKPVFSGPHWHLNAGLWFARWILAEGRMRALFSMLFGAGVILMTGRAEERGSGVRTADIFVRRNMWLVLIGIAHCYFIWHGDILYPYGMTALLFLFPCRNLKPKTLLWAGAIVLLAGGMISESVYLSNVRKDYAAAEKAYAAQRAHQTPTDAQKKDISTWEHRSGRHSQEEMYKEIAKHQAYGVSRMYERGKSYSFETGYFLPFLPDVLGMMLLGMGLCRNGFLTAKLRSRTYAICAAVGLGLAWPISAWGAWYMWKSGFEPFHMDKVWFTYQGCRLAGAIGNASVVLLLVKHGIFRRLLSLIAAVGQTALSNYLLTSLLMQTVFVCSPLHWYGYLEYYKIYLVLLGMWAINLTVSALWLRYFRFGPAEWAWRSLTYWKLQPMKLRA